MKGASPLRSEEDGGVDAVLTPREALRLERRQHTDDDADDEPATEGLPPTPRPAPVDERPDEAHEDQRDEAEQPGADVRTDPVVSEVPGPEGEPGRGGEADDPDDDGDDV